MPLGETFSTEKARLAAKIHALEAVVSRCKDFDSVESKVQYLSEHPSVKLFFLKKLNYFDLLHRFSADEKVLFLSLIMIDQVSVLFSKEGEDMFEQFKQVFSCLVPVEDFFASLGGLIGYQLEALKLLFQKTEDPFQGSENCDYLPPDVVDIRKENAFARAMKFQGIRSLDEFAEIYPIGGAADRLNLRDEKTFLDLPAARLEFLGHTLIEGMIRDLESREYLYYKIFHQRILTPVALMTSNEKNNHNMIQEIFKEYQYFNRPKESFRFFIQPLVPTFTKEGDWCLKRPGELLMKPGGHGAIWKLCADEKIFEWFRKKGRKRALVRQINNPIAGVDSGLAVLAGIGYMHNKAFGFASCPRKNPSQEGMNVLKIEKVEEGTIKTITNIEYCDFKRFGIEEGEEKFNPYSEYPANTNVLYVDLKAVEEMSANIPYPGKLINLKKMRYFDAVSGEKEEELARIELLMQNIAEGFFVRQKEIEDPCAFDEIPSFITFNLRNKTISTTKKQFIPGAGLVETAVGCYYDYIKNGWDLLTRFCSFELPALPSELEFLNKGPSFIFKYHPGLGPFYDVIGQKISKGSLSYLSELQLEIADVHIENLQLDGSLLIQAKHVLGHFNTNNQLVYSNRTGHCMLKNVSVVNQGIDKQCEHIFWKNKITRKESLEILLEGYSEFHAEDVTFVGSYRVVVPNGKKITAYSNGDGVVFQSEDLPSVEKPFWNYLQQGDSMILSKN